MLFFLRTCAFFALLIQSYCFALPLFDAYPTLKKTIAHVELCTLPTPIIKLNNLSAAIDHSQLYIKNDALTAPDFGGNKIRKLEFLLADALVKNASYVVAVGSAGSNFCCAAAVHAASLNIPCACFYAPQLNTIYLQRNALIAAAAGATLELHPSPVARNTALANFMANNPTAYAIPGGGSNALGALGFVNAAFELKEQINTGTCALPDVIFITYGSAGSAAGLLLGLKAAGIKSHVVVVQVCDPVVTVAEDITALFNQTNNLLCHADKSFQRYNLTAGDFSIDSDHYYGRYAKIDPAQADAIKLLNDTQGIKTDGTYAGKTLIAMLDYAAKNKNKSILFWNTFFSGRADVLKSHDYKKLPQEWHDYFDGSISLQQIDQGA